MSNPEMHKEIFRIILVGDVGTGKTTFLTQLIHRVPERLPKPTSNLSLFTMRISKPSAVVQIWDSPGDSKYYYQTFGIVSKFNAVLLFVDVTNQYTFQRARLISDQIVPYAKTDALNVHIIESKVEVVQKDPIKRKVSRKMLWQLADKFKSGVFQYRQNSNIEQIIQEVLEWKTKGPQIVEKQRQKDQGGELQQIKFEKQAQSLNCQCTIF